MKKVYLCKYEEFIYLTPNSPFPAPESVISLPPLDCLRFFEAAARLRSFAHAGEALDVTPPAVAHRIRMLESHLGAELFERGRRSVRLNRRGRAYYEEVRRILLDIHETTERFRDATPRRRASARVLHAAPDERPRSRAGNRGVTIASSSSGGPPRGSASVPGFTPGYPVRISAAMLSEMRTADSDRRSRGIVRPAGEVGVHSRHVC